MTVLQMPLLGMADLPALDSQALEHPTLPLESFWLLAPDERRKLLWRGIAQSHAWHFRRNPAYRQVVSARSRADQAPIDEAIAPAQLADLLRPTAQTFKSYIDLLGTPFPYDQPLDFVRWMAEQLSLELPLERLAEFRPHYPNLEALLSDFERVFADFGFEILTSSGTSGRATIMVRNPESIRLTVESFYLCFQRYLGIQADHRAIFIMPEQTRIAMVRMASFSARRIGLPPERVHYAIPFPAHPDQVRIRAGRTYRLGWEGLVERRLWHPLMNWANAHLMMPRAIRTTLELLWQAEQAAEKGLPGEKVLLFGGWIQLHAVALALRQQGRRLELAPDSLVGTGGGFKELYPYSIEQIRQDIGQAIQVAAPEGGFEPARVRDVYGMAEGNWAAMQCREGNYHIPPWVYAVTLDEDGALQPGPESTGLLAFFDPYGGGPLFPAFFRTADRLTLRNADPPFETEWTAGQPCPCGEAGAYIVAGSIQRVDLVDEAGCAAQV